MGGNKKLVRTGFLKIIVISNEASSDFNLEVFCGKMKNHVSYTIKIVGNRFLSSR
jgi:hypothetical protein